MQPFGIFLVSYKKLKNMKTLATFLSFSLLACFAFGQKRTVEVGSFTELSLGVSAKLYVKQGSNEKLEIECDDDIFDRIEFDKVGDRLSIRKEGRWNWRDGWRNGDVTIYVTMKEIERLSVSGSGAMEGEGTIDVGVLDLAVSGSGDMDLAIVGDELEIKISGSGSIQLAGTADGAEARISGSGKIKAEDLEVNSLEASISGSGSCYIAVKEEIEARISGSGSIYYSGNPSKINSNSSGSGKLKKM